MLNLCFFHDPEEYAQMQWDYLLLNFKPNSLYLIGADNETFSHRSPRSKAKFIKNISELPTNTPLVVMTPKLGRFLQGKTSLKEFEHPKDAIYIFGSDRAHLTPKDFTTRPPDHLVYIPVETDDEMFSFMAAAITIWDRKIKHG